ncbi:MAG: cation transporter [Myxococcaceae bacterium]|nr:cation transporter [Myxococcaceae bacterium]
MCVVCSGAVDDVALSQLERSRQVKRVLAWILVANWAVSFGKLALGIANGLASVTADGLHSFIDGSSNVIGLVAMSIAARPADEDHPYGHGKFEALASLAIGAMIGIGMLELGRMAFNALIRDVHPTVDPTLFPFLVATLVINLIVTRVEKRFGEKLHSPLLLADANHTLSDVFVTLAVLASVALTWFKVPRADGAVAILVLGFVAWVAWGIVKHGVGILSDTARLNPVEVSAAASAVPGVRRCYDVRSRGMEESIWVDLKIEVDPSTTTAQAHEIAHEVERTLTARYPQVVDVVVHVEPGPDPSGAIEAHS